VSLALVLALASTDCASCHASEAAALAQSRHAQAAELAVFRASAAHAGDRAWCATCHRPEGERAAGLDCLTCHRVAGKPDAILGTRGTPEARAAHEVVIDASLPTASCARCHEFATPRPESMHGSAVVYSTQPLQATVSELARALPAATCSQCHDVHRPTGGHDAALVRGAIAIAARSTRDGVELAVTAKHVGHRFPTGDPFRRLVLAVCEDPACEHVLARRTLGRNFALVDGVWAPVVDRTLADGETRVVELPAGGWWRIDYAYGDPRFEPLLEPVERSLELARGSLR
jgi:hypothetical protein